MYKNIKSQREKRLKKSKINCIKCVKLLNTSKDNLVCSKFENYLPFKCSRLRPKELSKHKKGKIKSISQFALTKTVLNVTDTSSMIRKEFMYHFCNLWIHKKCTGNTKTDYKILETIRKNLVIADLVKPTCFLFTA